MPVPLVENAPAKVNLTLRVLGRRADGYHELESLVVFADCGDRLTFAPGGALSLTLSGATAAQAGSDADNLVLKAARALAARIPSVTLGAFHLDKNLPVAAGLGGGSSDAAAALRLIMRANGLAPDDPQLYEAARATGADVPVCLNPRPRLMRGIGERLSEPLTLPPLPAVLVNPGVALATKDVFAGWKPGAAAAAPLDLAALAKLESRDQLLADIANAAERSRSAGDCAAAGDRRRACGLARFCRLSAWRACRAPARRVSGYSRRPPKPMSRRKSCAPNIRTGGCRLARCS